MFIQEIYHKFTINIKDEAYLDETNLDEYDEIGKQDFFQNILTHANIKFEVSGALWWPISDKPHLIFCNFLL